MDAARDFDERENRLSQLDDEAGSNASDKSDAGPVVHSAVRNRRVPDTGQDRNSKTVTKDLVGRFYRRFGFRPVRRRTKQNNRE